MQKNYSTAKAEYMCEIVKKKLWCGISPTSKFSIFFNLSKIYSTEYFIIFPISSSMGKKKIFRQIIWGHWLSF